MSYDIFISYRRKGAGAGVAGEIQTKLQNLGYKVFLDVDNIGSGAFPEQIDNAIRQCKDFLLILSPGMLDRCADEEDWVRHEIVLAKNYGKNIIGVSLPGYVMPEASELPEPLRSIPEIQVFLWSHEYRHASLEKIVENLVATGEKKKRVHRTLAFGFSGVVVAVIAVWMLVFNNPSSTETIEPTRTSENRHAMDSIMLVKNTYNNLLRLGDSLLGTVPNPTRKEEFTIFMNALSNYQSALAIMKSNPTLLRDTIGLGRRVDSLNHLRKESLDRELEAASKFLGLESYDFARFRLDNAWVLAQEEDRPKIEKLEKKLPN